MSFYNPSSECRRSEEEDYTVDEATPSSAFGLSSLSLESPSFASLQPFGSIPWAGFQFFDGTILDEDECLRCTAKSPLNNRFARNFIMNRDSLSPKVVLPILGLGCDFDIDVEITT